MIKKNIKNLLIQNINNISNINININTNKIGSKFAPSNIALCKYWGKRDQNLNLPVTSSLSISLGDRGATTSISIIDSNADQVFLNGKIIPIDSDFYQRVSNFLDLFREITGHYYLVKTISNIPIAAGVASSACGFAALTMAIDDLYSWQLSKKTLSIIARLGSGSACRSLWPGFVLWQAGTDVDGLDSFAYPLPTVWNKLRIGLLIFEKQAKPISSRVAMNTCVATSAFYKVWPEIVANDLKLIERSIVEHDFTTLGSISERNALAMHALMLSSTPPIIYSTAETISAMQKVWQARSAGLEVYFTQDAGPNLKLLFKNDDLNVVQELFPELEVINPFNYINHIIAVP